MRIFRISPSEWLFDLFFDPECEAISAYDVTVAEHVSWHQNWCRVELSWADVSAGSRIATIRRTRPVSIPSNCGIDALRVFAACSPGTTVTVSVSGAERSFPGTDMPQYHDLPILGRTEILPKLELTADRAGSGGATLIWAALLATSKETVRLSPGSHIDPSWEGLIDDDHDPAPRIDLLFDDEALDRIRERCRTPEYERWMEELRSRVDAMLAIEPESRIGRFSSDPVHYVRPTDETGSLVSGGAAHELAFVGLIDRDKRMLRHAARWALSLSHCEYWYNDEFGEIPGVRWHHRAFEEALVSYDVAVTLDWAGSWLSNTGRNVILDALIRRGMPRMQQDFVDPSVCEEIRTMNQGFHFNKGRVFALLTLMHFWPRVESWLDHAVHDAWEMFEIAYDDDGGMVEGPGYWQGTHHSAVTTLLALSHKLQRPPASLVPEKVARSIRYLPTMISLAEPHRCLRVADTHDPPSCYPDLAAMVNRAFPSRESSDLTGFAMKTGAPPHSIPLLCIFGPDEIRPVERIVPGFRLLEHTGLLVSVREAPGIGPVRLQLIGAGGVGGSHSHEDRGNLIVETGSDSVFADRGVGHYSSTLRHLLRPYAHNLAVPEDPSGNPSRQNIEHETDITPKADAEGDRLEAHIDTTAAWPDYVLGCARTIISDRADHITLIDELTLSRELPVTVHFHTPLQAAPTPSGVSLTGPSIIVGIEPQWECTEIRVTDDPLGAGEHDPTYRHIALAAPIAAKHRLETRIVLAPKAN